MRTPTMRTPTGHSELRSPSCSDRDESSEVANEQWPPEGDLGAKDNVCKRAPERANTLLSEGTVAVLKMDYPMLSWPKGQLTLLKKVLFGFPFLGYFSLIYMKRSYMKIFYIDDYPRASLGLITFFTVLGLLIDAFSDPFVANLSDNTRHKWGRRRPYILASSFVYMFVCVLSYTPLLPPGVGASIWYGIFHIAFNIINTLVIVPLEGWGAEMTPHCKERSDLWMWRELFLIVGILIGAVVPAYISNIAGVRCTDNPGDGCIGLPLMSGILGVVHFLAISALVFFAKERPMERLPPPQKERWSEDDTVPTLIITWLNRPFKVFIIGAVTEAFGSNMPFSIMPFFARIVLGGQCMRPAVQFSLFALVNLASRLLFLPLWIMVGRRLGKFRSYLWFNFILAGSYCLFIFLGKDDGQCRQLYLGICLIAIWGIVYSGDMFMKSIMSDIVDYDEFLSGRRREGQYMMAANFLPKFIEIPSEAIPFLLMAYLGYQRPPEHGPDIEQPQAVVWLMKLCFSFVPGVCILLGAIVLLWYPKHAWDDASHQKIVEAIKNQHGQGLPAEDPWFPGHIVPPPPTESGPHEGLLANFLPFELRRAAEAAGEVRYGALKWCALRWSVFAALLVAPGVALLVLGWKDLEDDLGASLSPFGLLVLGLSALLLWFHGVRLRAALAAERLGVPREAIVARYNFLCRYTGETPIEEAAESSAQGPESSSPVATLAPVAPAVEALAVANSGTCMARVGASSRVAAA